MSPGVYEIGLHLAGLLMEWPAVAGLPMGAHLVRGLACNRHLAYWPAT